ncbi:MAG TPA: acyl-CoA dehydrogenase family protein [Solirubrobacterales bacterium]|nr:acyl-CoA dehydrogenase family protein [Solirubrobacterales bacterium]
MAATTAFTTGADPFHLGDDQLRLREMASAFAADRLAPDAVRWDREKTLPVDVLREAATLGMGGIYVDEEHGGSGLSRLEATLIFEALAAGCPTVAAYLSIHNMVAWMVDRYGSAEQRGRWLPGLCSMEILGAYCLTEAEAGSDAAALRSRAVRDGEGYVLDGEKQFISGAGVAGLYVVMTRTGAPGPGGITAMLVPGDSEGLSFGAPETKMGWNAQPTRPVAMQGVRLPVDARLGEEGGGFRIAMAGLDGGRLNIAACSLGGAQEALDRSVAYVSGRHAFGGPLAALQNVQFQLADMATELEAARTLLWRAAAALDAGDAEATRLCAMAKRFATDAGIAVADRALQMHGGYGYLAEYGIEKIVRDLRAHQIVEGANEVMRLIVARELVGGRR